MGDKAVLCVTVEEVTGNKMGWLIKTADGVRVQVKKTLLPEGTAISAGAVVSVEVPLAELPGLKEKEIVAVSASVTSASTKVEGSPRANTSDRSKG